MHWLTVHEKLDAYVDRGLVVFPKKADGITLIEGRLHKLGVPQSSYQVEGRPTAIAEARALAARDKHQFQWWASWRLGAQVYREEKRGADRGIDGNIFFHNGPYGTGRIIVSVTAAIPSASSTSDAIRRRRPRRRRSGSWLRMPNISGSR
jgi:hypothetical protein